MNRHDDIGNKISSTVKNPLTSQNMNKVTKKDEEPSKHSNFGKTPS